MEDALDQVVQAVQDLEWIGASTNMVGDKDLFFIPAGSIADSIGMDVVLVKVRLLSVCNQHLLIFYRAMQYMIAVYLCCPLGLVLRLLPGSNLKHLFSFGTGLLLVQWVFASTWIHPFIASLFTYLVCIVGPKKYNHVIVMIFQLVYLFCCHAYYQYAYYLSTMFAFTGTQMVLVMKLSAFAYNVHDGRRFAKAKVDGKSLSRSEEVMERLAITKFPTLLEFLGYAFCFTAILAGPSFEYQVT